jgi:hypothetical protein
MQMQRHHARVRACAFSFLPLVLSAASAAAQVTTVAGFAAEARSLPAPANGWSGLDVLPDGSPVTFDGQRLVELDPATGAIRRTLASITPAFATDVAVGPTGGTVFFGESSSGAIHVHELATSRTRQVTTLGGNFSFTFHPDEGERFLWVTAQPGFTGPAKVFRVDTVSGSTDLIAEATGFAGPLLIDPQGNLYFAPGTSFTVPGQGRILRWSRAQVLSAIGPGSLTETSAQVFARGFDNAIDLARDAEGTFYVADARPMTGSLLEIGKDGGSFARGVLVHATQSLTALCFGPGPRPFERFGSAGSRLLLLASDFGGGDSLLLLTPRRPDLTVTPTATPLPDQPLRYDASLLPAGTSAVWLLGAGLVPEKPLLPLGADGLRFPDLGIVPSEPFVLLVTAIDGTGRAALSVRAPAMSGFAWTTQILAGPVAALPGGTKASPWVSTRPLTVRVQ